MKTVYIMRGLPGSGKTTWARKLVSKLGPSPSARIHSNDDYMLSDGGVYEYQGERQAALARKTNLEAFKRSLASGFEVVICDNCNLTHYAYFEYVREARMYGYHVRKIVMPMLPLPVLFERTIHKMPQEVLMRMYRMWAD